MYDPQPPPPPTIRFTPQRDYRRYGSASVVFELVDVEDQIATQRAGYPVYTQKEILKITFPGQGPKVVEVNDEHRREYAAEYAAFRQGLEQPASGMPLKQWAQLPRNDYEALKAHGFQTVEQLADAPDSVKTKLGAAGVWVKRAQEFLKAATEGPGVVVALREQIETMRMQMIQQQNQIMQLLQRVEAETGDRLLTPEMVTAHDQKIAEIKGELPAKKAKKVS